MECVLLEKIHAATREEEIAELNASLKELASGLTVSFQVLGIADGGWIKLGISGPDSEIFGSMLLRRFGAAPVDLRNVMKHDVRKGLIEGVSSRGDAFLIDIGIIQPSRVYARYPLDAARGQLANGNRVQAAHIATQYCLQNGFPVEVRITELDVERTLVEAWLSDGQLAFFEELDRLPLDRIVSTGATQGQVEAALKKARAERDIISVESLALTTCLLTCKLGTDAAGMIARLGPFLGRTKLFAFIPRASRGRAPKS